MIDRARVWWRSTSSGRYRHWSVVAVIEHINISSPSSRTGEPTHWSGLEWLVGCSPEQQPLQLIDGISRLPQQLMRSPCISIYAESADVDNYAQ